MIRNLLFNHVVMDENRKLYEPRQIRKPRPYYSAKKDNFGNPYGKDNKRPDNRIR